MENTRKEKPSEDISKEVSEKIQKIDEIYKELDELQNRCTHPETTIKNVGPKKGSTFNLRKICAVCEKELAYPTQDEISDWLDK